MPFRHTSPTLALLAEVLRPHRGRLAALGVVLAVASLAPLVGPQLLRGIIDGARAGAPVRALLGLAAAYVGIGLVAQAATVATTTAADRLAWSATNGLRERATGHVLSLDLAAHGRTTPGVLVERVDGDADAVATLFTDVVVKVTGGLLTLVGALLLVTAADWRAGLAMTAVVALLLPLVSRLRARAVPDTVAERAAYADVIGVVAEQLDASEDLRALGAGGFAVARHAGASDRHTTALVRAWRRSAEVVSTTTGAFAVGGVLMLTVGWLLHRRGAVSVGTVFLVFQYVQLLRRPVELLAEQLEEVQKAAAGAARLRDLLDTHAALRPGGQRALPAGPLALAFDDVAFTYPGDEDAVLRDLTLEVPAGTVTAVVGRTGSGKTTLARLALRLLDPGRGTVRVGGEDLRAVAPAALRTRLAVVTQDVQLFDASVRDNLTLFEAGWSDDVLAGLLDDLGLGAWRAALPAGLDTAIGGDDAQAGLSAGQAQLLGIARAFLRDPGLVVLDEASSRVDPHTAGLVEAALDRLLAGRTAVVIAHRLAAVERADTVVVLDRGRVVEQGPRRRLVADAGSRFARLLTAEGAQQEAADREGVA